MTNYNCFLFKVLSYRNSNHADLNADFIEAKGAYLQCIKGRFWNALENCSFFVHIFVGHLSISVMMGWHMPSRDVRAWEKR